MDTFVEFTRSVRVHMLQCRFLAPTRKPTQLIVSDGDVSALNLRCNHGRHPQLRGRNPDGTFRTAEAAWYSPSLCKAIADTFMVALRRGWSAGRSHPYDLGRIGSQFDRPWSAPASMHGPWRDGSAWTWPQPRIGFLEQGLRRLPRGASGMMVGH